MLPYESRLSWVGHRLGGGLMLPSKEEEAAAIEAVQAELCRLAQQRLLTPAEQRSWRGVLWYSRRYHFVFFLGTYDEQRTLENFCDRLSFLGIQPFTVEYATLARARACDPAGYALECEQRALALARRPHIFAQ